MKKYEREIVPHFEEVAKTSCEQAINDIKQNTGIRQNSEGATEICASYDMGWQRRSSGRA